MNTTKRLKENMTKLFRFAASVLFAFGFLAASTANAGTSTCVENGGSNQCNPQFPQNPWRFDLCDDMGSTVQRSAAWCSVKGGTWNSQTSACDGITVTVSASNASGLASSFENIIHPPTGCGPGGAPAPCSQTNCTCHTVYSGGVLIETFGLTAFSGVNRDQNNQCNPVSTWAENVVLKQTRDAGCPPGNNKATLDNGSTECSKQQPCDKCKGNPVEVGSGDKRQREVDYASPAPGGLSFVRLYNSGGVWENTSVVRDYVATDFWRHNYSASIVPFTGNAYVMAVAIRPSGVHRYFNLSGVEKHNTDGAAYRLVKQVDGGGNVTGWQLTTDENDVEAYDAQGKLVSITTRAGFVTTLAYTGARLTTVTDAFGRSLALTYDGSGRLATMTDTASRVYQYGYDSLGRLVTVTYPDTTVRTYLYENTTWLWALTGIVDERGARYATYGYDYTGRASSTEHAGTDQKYTFSWADYPTQVQVTGTDAFGASLTYYFNKVNGALKLTTDGNSGLGQETRTYDANGNVASITDRRNTVTNFSYDLTRNLQTSRTEAYGTSLARTITTTWHATYRLPATITEPSGVSGVNLVTTFTYDTAGNLTKKNLTAGSVSREWNYTYNARGQVLTIDGPRTDVTDVTTIAYYSDTDTCVGCRGQIYTVTNAAGHITIFNSYDADGRPTQITDANGVATTLTYKTRGWLASRSAGGETTSFDYDAVGNLSKVTLPDSSWVHYLYDAANGLVAIDDSLGNVIDYELDVMGNRVREDVYDPQQVLRKTLEKLYDLGNRLQKELGASAQTTSYAYDGNSNVTSVTDPLFRVTTNTYDALNRLTNINDPATGNTVFTYDAKDRLATVKDPKLSATTSYTYNGLGDLLTQVSPDTGTTTFTYDNAGNVATQTDARSTQTTYTYDVLNRVTAATVTNGTVSYEYDNTTTGGAYARGKLTKVTDPSGNTTYVYDSLGRVTSKTQTTTASPSNKSFAMAYSYASGRQTGITYPSGRAITYGFNGQGQVTSITVDGTTTVLSSGEYFPFGAVKKWTWGNGQVFQRSFDLDGRIKTLTLGPSTTSYADLSQLFGFDGLNRLITANLAAGQTQSFTYDSNSNRATATINAATTNYTYPSTSHKLSSLSGATTRSFTYDNAGNITASAGITYTFDGRGRMSQASTTSYLINGLGQRVKKSNATDTFFAYDEAGHLIGEYDVNGAAIQETVWLGDLPIAVLKPTQPSGFALFYVWADHLGTPRQITDTSNLSRWEWGHNDPFANNTPNENPAGQGTFSYNLRFPGQYFDVETGTHYNYFRDYDPAIGRYVESDPIGMKGGINTYSYVSGEPLIFTDRLGLASDDECCLKTLPQSRGDAGWVACCDGRKVGCSDPTSPKWSTNQKVKKIFQDCTKGHEQRHFPDTPPCLSCTPEPTRVMSFRSGVSGAAGECPAYLQDVTCLTTALSKCGNDSECREQVRHLLNVSRSSAKYQCDQITP